MGGFEIVVLSWSASAVSKAAFSHRTEGNEVTRLDEHEEVMAQINGSQLMLEIVQVIMDEEDALATLLGMLQQHQDAAAG